MWNYLVPWIWHLTTSGYEAPVVEFVESTPSLTLLSGPLWPGVVVPVRVPSKGQIELFNLLLKITIDTKKNYLY